jgi:hypothetical protein
MPFISPEQVKTIRNQIKAEFPTFKFSVVGRDHSEVSIYIMEGDIDFINKDGNSYVNEFYINENWSNNEPARNMLNRIREIANQKNRILVVDQDYGAVPCYYLHIGIGRWDKPYVLKQTKKVEA